MVLIDFIRYFTMVDNGQKVQLKFICINLIENLQIMSFVSDLSCNLEV